MIVPSIAGAVLFAILAVAVIRRIPLSIALRDFRRRPVQSLLIIVGLLVASLVIAAALVAGDSMQALFRENVFRAWGPADVRVGSISGRAFSEQRARAITDDPAVVSSSDARVIRLEIRAAVEAIRPGTREPRVGLIGIESEDSALGRLGRTEVEFTSELASAVVNVRFARALQVGVGDDLKFNGVNPLGVPFSFSGRIIEVVPNSGKADWARLPNAFVPLDSLQAAAGLPGGVNQVLISAEGGARSPRKAGRLAAAVEKAIAATASPETRDSLQIAASKARDLRSADETSQFFRSLLGMLGGVVAVTSVALIINLFVMLGEERRSELGTMRALGLRRSGLVLVGLTEGVLYAASAALVGAVIGGWLGRYIGDAMAELFRGFAAAAAAEFAQPPFEFNPRTLLTAAGAGFLVSVAAVAFVSFKTSRLTVVAAIRDLPEERHRRSRNFPWWRYAVLAAGAAMIAGPLAVRATGGALIALGAGALLSHYGNRRLGTSLGALGALGWGLWVQGRFDPDFQGNPGSAFAFIASTGVATVIAGVVLLSANLPVLGGLARVVRTGGSTIKTAVAYASSNRFKTAMSIAMFALVIYMIAGFAVWGSFGSADFEKESGGFGVFARATVPIENLQVQGAEAIVPLYAARYELGYKVGDSQEIMNPAVLYGIGPEFVDSNRFSFSTKPSGTSDREVWESVLTTPMSAVVDRSTSPGTTEVGEQVQLRSDQEQAVLGVAGVADEFVFNAIFMSKETFGRLYPGRAADTVWFIRLQPGISEERVIAELEKNHSSSGLDASNLRVVFDEAASSQRTFVGLFQLLLKMGLLIGISSLAIAAVRTVIERRHQIGLVRALGFRRSMVASWLVLEALIVATIGVAIGLLVGIAGAYLVITLQVQDFRFGVDWPQIASALVIVYAAILGFTSLPAIRAAALDPADAIRYVE